MEYKGILKRRTKSRNLLILAVGAVLLLLECESKQYIYIPFTALIMVAVFHKKDHVVSEAGVDIRRSIFGMVSDNRWKWSEISAVQPDYIGARPNTKVTFQKGSMLRSFLFTPEDADAVLKLAASMNPEMFIDAYTEEEQEKMEQEKRRREEQLRAQRAQAKRAKKKR